MSSFSPPPFSSSPPTMGGFSPPPMDDFSPPPMSSFSPPPINGFSPPPLDDGDDVIGDHFGLRRHSDMSDDNSFDLTGFSDKMKKIEIEKIKHLPPREILEIQRESMGEKREIFVSLNGLDLETEQRHKKLFINNQTHNCPSANSKLNANQTDIHKPIERTDEAEIVNEVENGKNSDDTVGDVLDQLRNDDGSDFNEPQPLVFGDLTEHEVISEPLDFDDFKADTTSDNKEVCDQLVKGSDNLIESKDLVANSENNSQHNLGESESGTCIETFQEDVFDDTGSIDESSKSHENEAMGACEDTFGDQLKAVNDEDLQLGEDLTEARDSPTFETELNSAANEMSNHVNSFEVPHKQDTANVVSEKDDSDDFNAFESFVEEDSAGFEPNWVNSGSGDPTKWDKTGSEDPFCEWGTKVSGAPCEWDIPGSEDPSDWDNQESERPSDWASKADQTLQVQPKSTNIEFDSDDDDDFGDFGDADDTFGDLSQSIPAPAASHNSIHQSQIEFDDLVVKLLPKVSTVIINMYESVIVEPGQDEDEKEEDTEDLVQNVLKDPVIWEKIEDPSSAPALEYTWVQSTTYSTILNTLNIDTRNVLDGEGWTNSRPKFAANLMTPGLLQPLSADTSPSVQELAKQVVKTKDEVQPAEFDWTNSGLVNPLETDGKRRKSTAPSTESLPAISELPLQKKEQNSTKTPQLDPSLSNGTSLVSSSVHCTPFKLSQDHCAPLKPKQDPNAPLKPHPDPNAPLKTPQDQCAPFKPPQDQCAPFKPPQDQCAPFKPPQDQCAPFKTPQDPIKRKEKLSREAAAVLDAFPLLTFMNSPVLTFPVKSVERKGKRKN